jgi:hypothetical protein
LLSRERAEYWVPGLTVFTRDGMNNGRPFDQQKGRPEPPFPIPDRPASADDAVQRCARAHDGVDLVLRGVVVAAGVGRRALDAVQLTDDLVLVGGQCFGDRGELGLQVRVLVLGGQACAQ